MGQSGRSPENAEFRLAATTVLGVVPLLPDVFRVGLAFGTVLTMVLFPMLYSVFYRASRKRRATRACLGYVPDS